MGYTTVELTFGDWILRVLVIFTLTLVLLLLLVDNTLSSSSAYQKSGCRVKITPAERKRSMIPSSKAILSNSTAYHKIVSFAKGTKFFRLPRPKSKRQLLREQQELQQQQQQQSLEEGANNKSLRTPIKFPTLAGMTPPPPKGLFATNELNSTADWKRAHRLLRQAMKGDPPAHKHNDHDEREDMSSSVGGGEGGHQRADVRDEAHQHTVISKHLFCGNMNYNHDGDEDGFDADSERDDDDTAGDHLSAPGSMVERDDDYIMENDDDDENDGFDADSERDDDDTAGDHLSASGSMVERDDEYIIDNDDDDDDSMSENGSCSKLSKHTSSTSVLALDEDEDSMILFEDDDDDTYEDTTATMLGTHTCYSPLRASESSDDTSLEEELKEALVETIEQLSPNRLCI